VRDCLAARCRLCWEDALASTDWKKLTPLQLGRYAEYFAKMEFASHGFEVYTAEVDDHGVDFVVKRGQSQYFDVQVKSARDSNYIFFEKSKFRLRPNLLAAIVLFVQGKPPRICLIPATQWLQPTALLVSRDYEGKKSKPEWGLQISNKTRPMLEEFGFDQVVGRL
jgi:hypothetical protein